AGGLAGRALRAGPCALCRLCLAPECIPFRASGLRGAHRLLRRRALLLHRAVRAWRDRAGAALVCGRFRGLVAFRLASFRLAFFRPAWLQLRLGLALWAEPSTAWAGLCSESGPCRSCHRAANGGTDGESRKASFPLSEHRGRSKIIPGCTRAHRRGALRLARLGASPESRRTAPGRWSRLRSSASPNLAPLAGSRGTSSAFGRSLPRP